LGCIKSGDFEGISKRLHVKLSKFQFLERWCIHSSDIETILKFIHSFRPFL